MGARPAQTAGSPFQRRSRPLPSRSTDRCAPNGFTAALNCGECKEIHSVCWSGMRALDKGFRAPCNIEIFESLHSTGRPANVLERCCGELGRGALQCGGLAPPEPRPAIRLVSLPATRPILPKVRAGTCFKAFETDCRARSGS